MFKTETDRLAHTEATMGDTAHFNVHGRWSVELGQSTEHVFSIKVTDASAAARSVASTVQDPAQICGQSAAFECHNLEHAAMQGYRLWWPALYEADPDLQLIWRERATTNGATSFIKACYGSMGLQARGSVCLKRTAIRTKLVYCKPCMIASQRDIRGYDALWPRCRAISIGKACMGTA